MNDYAEVFTELHHLTERIDIARQNILSLRVLAQYAATDAVLHSEVGEILGQTAMEVWDTVDEVDHWCADLQKQLRRLLQKGTTWAALSPIEREQNISETEQQLRSVLLRIPRGSELGGIEIGQSSDMVGALRRSVLRVLELLQGLR